MTGTGASGRRGHAARSAVMRGALVAALAAGSAVASAAGAQTIADRVQAAPDGEIRLTFASRPGACGDGGDMVALGRTLIIWPSIETYGDWSARSRCVPGPVRVVLTVRDHEVTSMRTHVGGSAAAGARTSAERGITDLGTVPAAQAARYFLSLAGRLEGRASRDALLPAVLADSAAIAPELLRIARDTTRPADTRRRAIMWTGTVGDASVVPALETMARDADTPLTIRGSALAALARLPGGAPWLLDVARHGGESIALRKKALFWAGQGDVPTASLGAVYDEVREPELRKQAIFVLSQRDERAATDKLFQIVRTDSDFRMRKQALFWLAQRDDPRVTRMISDLVTH